MTHKWTFTTTWDYWSHIYEKISLQMIFTSGNIGTTVIKFSLKIIYSSVHIIYEKSLRSEICVHYGPGVICRYFFENASGEVVNDIRYHQIMITNSCCLIWWNLTHRTCSIHRMTLHLIIQLKQLLKRWC